MSKRDKNEKEVKQKNSNLKKDNLPKTSSNYTKKRSRKRNKSTSKKIKIEEFPTKKQIKNNKEQEKNKNKKVNKRKKNKKRRKTNRRKRNNNKKKMILIILTLVLIIALSTFCIMYKINQDKKQEEFINNKIKDIKEHYNKYVITNKEIDLYKLENNEYIKKGKVGINQELILEEIDITPNDEYFKITTFNDIYHVYYKDVDIIENLTENDQRYKRYIVFNKNIITKDITNFYNKEGLLVYTLPKSYDLPIIINKNEIYGVEFNNQLLYVKQEDVLEIKKNNNTNELPSNKVRTLAYHRIYDPKTEKCDQVICHTESQFESHMKYLSENNYLTLNTKELSDFIDGYIQIPKKSTVITIDDGTMVKRGITILEKYKLNASLFIITVRFKESDYENNFKSNYVELHSHSHDMHWAGECAGYGTQGGGILCLPEQRVLDDLKTSSDILNGSKVFCYPFYDYNTRAINLLKKAGYNMAFAGLLNANGFAYVGTNKMLIPRATILSYTTFAEFKAYVTY